jgi:hypothetical protein
MPYKEEQPTLMQIFILSWIPLKQIVQKKLFGKDYISAFYYAQTLARQYETGALLGRSMIDKLDIFHKMILKPGTDIDRSIAFIQSEAKDRLREFIEKKGKEPNSFNDFIALEELDEVSNAMGLSMEYDAEEPKSHLQNLRKVWEHEFILDDVQKKYSNYWLLWTRIWQ